jgi:hypothetical protein
MKMVGFEAIVENGQIRLPPGVQLPDNTTVYVSVRRAETNPAGSVTSPHLPGSEQTNDFAAATEEKDTGDARKTGEALLAELAGSWEGDETPEEWAASLRKARRSGRRFKVPDVSP